LKAAERRETRESTRRQRDLERQAKTQHRLSRLEQARLEVEADENALAVLLSVHKEKVSPWDWIGLASALPPLPPWNSGYHERLARISNTLLLRTQADAALKSIQDAVSEDESQFAKALASYTDAKAAWADMRDLSRRILAGDPSAYLEAIQELTPLDEIASLGSSAQFIMHSALDAECQLKVSGAQVIPTAEKRLTPAGKVTVKPIPRARFHEIYQDYVCSAILRVARELFSLLPLQAILVTATADVVDSGTGRDEVQPVLSVVISRAEHDGIDYDRIDPSDAIERMTHRRDFRASRRSGAFRRINPLEASDLKRAVAVEALGYKELLARARNLEASISAMKSTFSVRKESNVEEPE
jgi:hypothetical protein